MKTAAWYCLFLVLNAQADDDSSLGYGAGLSGDSSNGAVVLPTQPAVSIPNGVRPLIVLPPESLSGYTLIVPFPDSGESATVIQNGKKKGAVSPHGMMPQNGAKLPVRPVLQ